MAGSSTTVTTRKIGDCTKIKAVWLSDDATGAVSGVIASDVVGKPMLLTTVPGTAGLAPDDNYDITITDENGIDILAGLGANRDIATTEHVIDTAGMLFTVATSLTLNVTNAGNANGGTVYLTVLDMFNNKP